MFRRLKKSRLLDYFSLFLYFSLWGGFFFGVAFGAFESQCSAFESQCSAFEPLPLDENGKPVLTEYVRLQKSSENVPLSLETSLIHYESTLPEYKDVSIDLIGVIHFADESYYQTLNEHFKNYDVVLFEMVIPKNTRFSPEFFAKNNENESSSVTPKNSSRENRENTPLFLIGDLQKWVGESLHFTYQLNGIDYSASNLTHCDLDAETVYAQMFEKGDIQEFVVGSVLDLVKPSSGTVEAAALMLLFSQNRIRTLKRIAAQMIYQSFSKEMLETEENAVIGLRNHLVLKQLRQEIGAEKKRIAIFYGVAHLPHFSYFLEHDFHFEAKSQCWLKAWDLSL